MAAFPLRVLLVDDYEPFRRFVRSTLETRADLQIIGEASDGLEAVQRAEELRPDLILLDIGLPSLNGVEVARRILSLAPETRIIFISQESSAEIAQETLRSGAVGYIFKAHTGSDLFSALEAVRQGRQFISSGLSVPNFKDAEDSQSRPVTRAGSPIAGTQNGKSASNHEVQFYSDDASFLVDLARFVETELESGNVFIAIMTEAHGSSVRQRLQAQGVDVATAIRQGRYLQLDAAETLSVFMDSAGINREKFLSTFGQCLRDAESAAAVRHKKVVVFGEMVAILCAEGKVQTAIQLEQLGTELAQRHSIYVRCAYPMTEALKGEPYSTICAEHSAVLSEIQSDVDTKRK